MSRLELTTPCGLLQVPGVLGDQQGAAKVFQVLCPVLQWPSVLKNPLFKNCPRLLGSPVGIRWRCSSLDKTGSLGALRLETTYSVFPF